MAEKTFLKDMWDTIRQGDLERVVALIDADRERLHMTTVFGTWLHFAASEGQLEIVKYFISQGLDVNARSESDSSGYTPINAAASKGYVEVVRYLLSCGAILDVSRGGQENPLFRAVLNGHTEVVKLLIDSGIDTKIKYNTKTMRNMDALALAYEWGQSEVVKILRPYSLGEPVFWDRKGYCTPVIDDCYIFQGWKDFDLQGNRLGIYNSNAKKRVRD
ncbi:ankyrin repeat domain-containing protein [Microcoleus sp. FACHB-831]|uniref:ankyrin repeat domain-containing protein n=1 Tax=Microcoleus sp. FACHB-831 TaxID=2692827 RepID=UPI001682B3AB|nr:ankyrin repeat domain-containing protein [Microcoleus sp. FACHB-831]MBD1922957.1 ankyrin repeat domain-containing protein [Microcoleus sp. FACHB-831]